MDALALGSSRRGRPGAVVTLMQEWKLPRALVHYCEALADGDPEAGELLSPVLEHAKELEHRIGKLCCLLLADDSEDAIQSWTEALSVYADALQGDDLGLILESSYCVQDIAESITKRASSLPRMTGSGPLDELFLLGSALVDGQAVPEPVFMGALVGAREVISDLERRSQSFYKRYPQEEAIREQLEPSLETLREGLGGAFLFAVGEIPTEGLKQALSVLVRGGNSAVACLAAMEAVEKQRASFSSDPVLEEMYQAWKAGDQERLEVVSHALEALQLELADEVEGLFLTFAPRSWRDHHLTALNQTLEQMERAREELFVQPTEERFHQFRDFAVAHDKALESARDSRPDRSSLPDVSHFVGLLELMGAVFEERAPFYLLEDQLQQLLDSFREYSRHLERLYNNQESGLHKVESLVAAVEDLGEALSLANKAVEERAPELFCEVWDLLVEPLRALDDYVNQAETRGLGMEAQLPLPPYFAELRLLLQDYLRGLIDEEEFDHSLKQAEQRAEAFLNAIPRDETESELSSAPSVLGELRQLFTRVRHNTGPAEVAWVERLGQRWESEVSSEGGRGLA